MESQHENNLPAMDWWNKKRLKYNIGLVISGFIAFALYLLVVEFVVIPKDYDAEITLLDIILQGIGYLIMISVANLLYYIGPISEIIICPQDISKYRKLTYEIGYWFSIILPLSIPILLLILNM